ncbi:hypothetical protein BDN72DRAFT_835999 [Pluteus cervinus]|uniref:Uncharacterized protein n=1 Tax=Pluteus cervinus TaxID=181527 RepID=A0ACD3B3S0_9AGAR|nr:hypothetical protein BDN72DRAFT_835999 [Pluteus cervinus]
MVPDEHRSNDKIFDESLSNIYSIFSGLSNLHTMKLGGVYAASFIEYITKNSSTQSPAYPNLNTPPIPFESLRFLGFPTTRQSTRSFGY